MRHNYQTERSAYWKCAAGPVQGALTLKQNAWLIRNHKKTLHEHHVYLYGLAKKVATCKRCNRRQAVHTAGQECKGCMHGGMFTAENGMSFGPRMQDEAALAAQVQRAALSSTFAKATDMEKNLVRAAPPVLSATRLVYQGHGQFSYKSHASGLANGGMEVALSLPRSPSEKGLHVICDPGGNCRTDPGLSHILYTRRALVDFLVKAPIVQNSSYNFVKLRVRPPLRAPRSELWRHSRGWDSPRASASYTKTENLSHNPRKARTASTLRCWRNGYRRESQTPRTFLLRPGHTTSSRTRTISTWTSTSSRGTSKEISGRRRSK
jgi:hypothetical protein